MSTNISTAATAVVVIIAFMFSLVVQAKESDREARASRSKTRSEEVWKAVFQTAFQTTGGNFIAAALAAETAVRADKAARAALEEERRKG